MPLPLRTLPLAAPGGGFGRTLEHLLAFSPAAGRAPVAGGVVLTGAVLVEVPRVTGDPVETALRKIRDRRLVPRVALVESAGTVDHVKTQDPKEGDFLPPGGVVTLYVITEREPTATEELIEAVRQAIKPGELAKSAELAAAVAELAKKSDLTAAVTGLAKAADLTAAVEKLPSRADLQTATGGLEKETDARARFEELRGLVNSQGKGPSGPKSS